MTKTPRRVTTAKAIEEPSLGSFLEEIGVNPLGRRVDLKKAIDQPPLRRGTCVETATDDEIGSSEN